MDTTLTLAPKTAIPALSYAPEQRPPSDKKVPVVKGVDASATLPAERPFVAQVVTARLSGTAFPDNPGEIAPDERTLRPYNTPMLPGEKDPEEDVSQEGITASSPAGQSGPDLPPDHMLSANETEDVGHIVNNAKPAERPEAKEPASAQNRP